MTKNNNRRKDVAAPLPFDQARDEMFQHISRCGVLQAATEHQQEWFDDTMGYLTERFHELTPEQFTELRAIGERFCQPPKSKAPADEASAA
ncbi:MAG: hypothetical protein ABJD07_12440 [Gemmatimonadaceae bacterium]